MKIRSKITAVVLPIIFVTLGLSGISAYFSATSGITRIANDLLNFKVKNLEKQTESQWNLIKEINATEDPKMINATKKGIAAYAISILESATEVIVAFDKDLNITMQTGDVEILEHEKTQLSSIYTEKKNELVNLSLGGVERVGMGFYFEPFDWYMIITEEKNTFYSDLNKITFQSVVILLGSIAIAVLILFIVTGFLTKPLEKVANTMKEIISDGDLSKRAFVEYQDETGELAHTFNIMVSELEKAYNQIKKYAFEAVLAQKKESKIRNIFQKYVPQELIDRFFQNPESMLVGDNRVLAVLFSDIRDFTTISESLLPEEIVNSLNRYFTIMVDIIMGHKGIIDKYIGDAIMAFFGAPVKHENDALQAVLAGIEMTEGVKIFNQQQKKIGKPEFKIGVGVNYGIVTVGNIGTEKKMDYTVIGDMVNLASRMEGLTKEYKQQILISESLQRKIKDNLPYRQIDKVAVKGKHEGIKVFATKKTLNSQEKEAWDIHNTAFEHYYRREFTQAAKLFDQIDRILQDDHAAKILFERCNQYIKHPPGEKWTGIHKMTTK